MQEKVHHWLFDSEWGEFFKDKEISETEWVESEEGKCNLILKLNYGPDDKIREDFSKFISYKEQNECEEVIANIPFALWDPLKVPLQVIWRAKYFDSYV